VGFRDVHEAAMRVIIEWLLSEGLLDEPDVETALRPERRRYTRYTLHGTSHMLGIDVHDCAHARNDVYFGELREGYVLTVEPGLYFQANDLTIPEHYRGIGVRIEDDILVTADGYRNMSGALPRRSDEVEAWMARLASQAAPNLGL
jgi:Xaa-Pro aminopeptidase